MSKFTIKLRETICECWHFLILNFKQDKNEIINKRKKLANFQFL